MNKISIFCQKHVGILYRKSMVLRETIKIQSDILLDSRFDIRQIFHIRFAKIQIVFEKTKFSANGRNFIFLLADVERNCKLQKKIELIPFFFVPLQLVTTNLK